MVSALSLKNEHLDSRRPETSARRGESSTVSSSRTSFAGIMRKSSTHNEEQQERNSRQHLEEMLEEMRLTENELQNNPSHKNFLKYRENIRQLLKILQSRVFKSETILTRKSHELTVVKVVNETLHELYSQISRPSTDTLIVLVLMGEIRGLLLSELA